jgi:hypothetical protein
VPLTSKILVDDERLTSLLGRSRLLREVRDGAGETSSLEAEDVGLPLGGRDKLDIRRSQVGFGDDFCSNVAAEGSLSPDVQGLIIPCLLTELSRESVAVLCVVAEGVGTLRRRKERDRRRSIRSDKPEAGVVGSEGGRGGRLPGVGEKGGCVAALEPGAFLLPGFMRYESPSDVPKARPAAATPRVPTAQS